MTAEIWYFSIYMLYTHTIIFSHTFPILKRKKYYWLFERVTYDTSFGYFMSGKNLVNSLFCWIPVWLHPDCRKARSRRTIRCGSSWTAGVSRWLWRAWRRASIACWRPTTPSWWSPPPSSSSRNATATWRRSAAWSTPRRTAWGRPWVQHTSTSLNIHAYSGAVSQYFRICKIFIILIK